MDDDFFDVGRLLLKAARDFSSQICSELHKRNHPGLKTGHALVVSNLDAEGTRASLLAERAEISKQAMGQLIKEMAALGYVSRANDPQDARAILVVPTEKGRQLLHDVEQLAAAMETRYVEKVGNSDLARLRQILLKCVNEK